MAVFSVENRSAHEQPIKISTLDLSNCAIRNTLYKNQSQFQLRNEFSASKILAKSGSVVWFSTIASSIVITNFLSVGLAKIGKRKLDNSNATMHNNIFP